MAHIQHSISRAEIIFGINALSGREVLSDGSTNGAWDSTNAESFMRYTVKKNYTMYAWELGNHPFSHLFPLLCLI